MNKVNMEQSINDYLDALKLALADQDPALIQDALYDAQEHLRAATQDEPSRSFDDISEDYGSPTEIAQFYCEMESTVELAFNGPAKKTKVNVKRPGFFAILKDPQAYRAMIYLFLTLPLGLVYFAWVVIVGLACLGSCLFVVGIPVFFAYLKSMQLFSLFEGRLIETLLGQRMPRRPRLQHSLQQETAGSLWQIWSAKFNAELTNRRNWTTIGYLLLQCGLGFVYFLSVVSTAIVSVAVFLSPLVDPILHAINPANTIDLNWYWFPVAMPGGVLGLMASLYLAKFIGKQQAKLAKLMLVER